MVAIRRSFSVWYAYSPNGWFGWLALPPVRRIPRQRRARHQMHLVALDELSRLGQADGRNRFVVLDDELDLTTCRPVPGLFEAQQEAVEDVAAVLRVRARERHDEADLDRRLGRLCADQPD